jgi:hypothetical protein
MFRISNEVGLSLKYLAFYFVDPYCAMGPYLIHVFVIQFSLQNFFSESFFL